MRFRAPTPPRRKNAPCFVQVAQPGALHEEPQLLCATDREGAVACHRAEYDSEYREGVELLAALGKPRRARGDHERVQKQRHCANDEGHRDAERNQPLNRGVLRKAEERRKVDKSRPEQAYCHRANESDILAGALRHRRCSGNRRSHGLMLLRPVDALRLSPAACRTGPQTDYDSRDLGELSSVFAGSRSTMSPSASSIRPSSSAGMVTPDATTFSLTCSGRDAPMIAEATFSF